MTRSGAAALGAALTLSACVYYNAIYNAEQALAEAERQRSAGQDSAAAALYGDVVRKAARGFRADPTGEWADQALLLLGRARLRLGEVDASRAALTQALDGARTRPDSLRISVFLAGALHAAGEPLGALDLVNQALRELPAGPEAAEAHLLRARIFLSSGQRDGGWWDLERAAAVDPSRRTEAAVEGLTWAISLDDSRRAEAGFARLSTLEEASARLDTLASLARGAERRWGPEVAATITQSVDRSAWPRIARDRLRLVRADFLDAAGDTAAAGEVARSVASGFGDGAAEGRLRLATWRLRNVRDLGGALRLRLVLLPASDHPAVAELLGSLDALDLLANSGLDEPLRFFAAGEVARDRLGAPLLARGLFLAYADGTPEDPWVPKALLAALDASPDVGDRAWLRGRLEGYSSSPYVVAAFGGSAPGFEELEEELAIRLREFAVR